MNNKEKISVLITIPAEGRIDPVRDLYFQYKQGMEKSAHPYEFVYVTHSANKEVLVILNELRKTEPNLKILVLTKWIGRATALNVGYKHCGGKKILILPEFNQIKGEEIPKLLENTGQADMVIAQRSPRKDSILNRIQSVVFHFLIRIGTGYRFHDLGCSVRVAKKEVFENITIYGDQDRFIPLLARQIGYRIKEVKTEQAQKDVFQRVHPVTTYLNRFLDILSIFFLVRFTEKPLRFFGFLGIGVSTLGVLMGIFMFYEKFYLQLPIMKSPALFISTFLIVVGIIFFAIGLIGEIIIFTHATEIKKYVIEEIIPESNKSSLE